jgi:hypothetical protein
VEIEEGQVFVECFPKGNARRVRVKKVFPDGADWVPSGMAFVVTLADLQLVAATSAEMREVRLRATRLSNLHLSPVSSTGLAWRTGYVLESVFPQAASLAGGGSLWHAVRPVATAAHERDVFRARCGMGGQLAQYGSRVTCPRCLARDW